MAPNQTPDPAALALIGMAAFFTATVRAPVTGIVLATEMTASTTQLAPMLGACAIAAAALHRAHVPPSAHSQHIDVDLRDLIS